MKTALTSTKLWAIIPAAGSGHRFSATELKQYQTLFNQTVLEHSVERLNHLPLQGYVLAVRSDDTVLNTLSLSHSERAHFCEGGAERVDSVLNALKYLSLIAHPDDYVLVHDAARPCVTAQSLEALVDYAVTQQTHAILATPVRDTLKKAHQQQIETTVDRSHLWQAQTPQIAKIGRLKQAIEQALIANVTITDEASALEWAGQPVAVVMGRADNIKITYPEDLNLAELIITAQQKTE
ncbi:2-C-methyl-D-erythritol 4-phosphate cytidylyltransferase [Acinetobacter sp. MD2(2019)]|uniref:2-C-methyl-D-erythritol 4-phosphate cytidylyltransferase n=1 Tax=Acinetobacter sp. MD2(2019) TaxID=2605273 RepID=UPI002D1E6256|nr:2-C-methyl-D-erythritol 4-phosphate cytidylyltransferase [Acinetobacter sp. MD2(2019)]MEB3752964.1 2-C-methyl-D-erythritol 4-phosphate cytidylyltransferase [Acinetobacter sp. MD2(2019)]